MAEKADAADAVEADAAAEKARECYEKALIEEITATYGYTLEFLYRIYDGGILEYFQGLPAFVRDEDIRRMGYLMSQYEKFCAIKRKVEIARNEYNKFIKN